MADRYARTRRALVAGGAVEELRSQQLALILASSATPMSPEEIARRSGISVEHALDRLRGLRGAMRTEAGAWSLTARFAATLRDDALGERLSTIDRALARQGRRTARTSRADMLGHLERAEHRLRVWDIEGARELLASSGLTLHELLARVPPRERAPVRARFMVLHATTFMNAGDPARAIAAFSRWRRSLDELPAVDAIRLLITMCAAHRMMPGGAGAALDALVHAERILDHNGMWDAPGRSLRRWLYTTRASPLTLLGAHDGAARSLAQAREQIEDPTGADRDAVAEIGLYEVRTLLARGEREAASLKLDEIRPWAASGSLWLRGWLPRYEADVMAGAPPARVKVGEHTVEVIAACLRAWHLCSGFGFQRDLVLARIAAVRPARDDVERALQRAWPDQPQVGAAALRTLRLRVADLHHERHGRRPSDCACSADGLGSAVAHATGMHEPSLLHHLT